MKAFNKIIGIFFLVSLMQLSVLAESTWKDLEPGLSLGEFKTQEKSVVGDSVITILKIDPKQWELDIVTEAEIGDKKNKTAKQWAEVIIL